MCGPSRPSLGGAIAILHPARHLDDSFPQSSPLPPSLEQPFRLLFHPPLTTGPPSPRLCLHFSSRDPFMKDASDAVWLVIYSDGDLASKHQRPPLWRFPVSACNGIGELDGAEDMQLAVGSRGVIGRRVELLQGRRTVAEGVVGWN
ncbi:hypothetical protein P152DRAFT_211120 [Eremomyces bilateralis CBS 781.70]|uniref:Uncharacterized protein n=1 Tax=Eremomyces bilateralis CBS 781.70 TaxID=1392243 RepID=A0A6G1FSC5_9PEZI|nr:uncharacterized protein P152DRAFT_211120 [Eremomyces bilateralis CBS 781.70]KAF1808684.1 hypothetical protein P152DRAFT_211120 [Eremomyces bilateralis CBS 781.70]